MESVLIADVADYKANGALAYAVFITYLLLAFSSSVKLLDNMDVVIAQFRVRVVRSMIDW